VGNNDFFSRKGEITVTGLVFSDSYGFNKIRDSSAIGSRPYMLALESYVAYVITLECGLIETQIFDYYYAYHTA
jgi:hypothetical protein